MACGGPQETYIVPTGAQPKGAAPPSPEPSSAAVMPEDPPGAPTVDGGGSAGDIPMGVDEGCGPTSNYSSKITLTPENSTLISGTISGGVSPNGPFLIDLMDVEGTQLYSLMCTQPQFEFRVPADNNLARLAFFEDADKNGPSETDKQGMSDLITLDTTPISGLQIELGSSVVEGFNFSGTAPSNIPPEDDVEREPPPPGMEEGFVPSDQIPPAQDEDIPPGDEAAAEDGPATAPPPAE